MPILPIGWVAVYSVLQRRCWRRGYSRENLTDTVRTVNRPLPLSGGRVLGERAGGLEGVRRALASSAPLLPVWEGGRKGGEG